MSKDVVLNYQDCILRQSDVDLLKGPCWLNDAIIGFYFEYLGKQHENVSLKFLFVCPELAQLLKLTDPHEYPIFLDPIEAKDKPFVFFPINDCNSRSSSGGSHWSLMVFSKKERACFYFDSSNSMNSAVARDFSRKVMDYLLDGGKGQFIEVDCPQQDNGYDCGLFVLCFADVIAEHVLRTGKVDSCNYDRVKSFVHTKRRALLALIEKLKGNHEN
ncbi:sentrin-specific protease 8 [Copidosoma floridanum]|uniref:sentrin-specific protease 8 n=1 Tax=Copidosoma floridanum TaxID=29053 RepID=UPI0006C9AC10|nr:sentrin-specific protease 8 [Copidosoma floridanum]XP_014213355.1 sentrin-specific protease 8 [Copidosoma floridanum]